MTGTLDTLTNLELQCLGLWILLRTSSGNGRDSGILLLTSSGNECSNMRGSRGGTRGPDPSGKSQVICVFMEISIWTPPPSLKNVGPPCITVKSVEGFKKTLLRLFFGSRTSPPPSLPLTKIPGSAHRKEIVIASPRHLNYVHENVVITSKVIFKHFPTAIFPSYGTTVSFSIPQTYHLLT